MTSVANTVAMTTLALHTLQPHIFYSSGGVFKNAHAPMIRRRRRGKERFTNDQHDYTITPSLGHGAAVVRVLLLTTRLQPPDLVLHPQLLGLGRVEAEVLRAVRAAGLPDDGPRPGRVPRQE